MNKDQKSFCLLLNGATMNYHEFHAKLNTISIRTNTRQILVSVISFKENK